MTTANPSEIFETGFETEAITMVPYWQISFKGPEDDLDRIFDEVIKIDPLIYGRTDRSAFRSAEGYEYYRPLDGTPTGAEDDTRKRPGVMNMTITIAPDRAVLSKIIEAIYTFHSYYEAPISVLPVLRSRTNGLDDSENPHRWWNTKGDWKTD
ncbi:MAG: hypothetical protein AAF353_00615 [Pseudomonadota bacterium]